jgi:hypothetical protein
MGLGDELLFEVSVDAQGKCDYRLCWMGDGSAWVAFHPIEFTATTMTSLQQPQKRLRQFYRRTEMYCVIFSKLNWSTLLGV